MKARSLFIFFIFFSITAFTQEITKANDALLLEYYQDQRFDDALAYLKKTYPEPVAESKTLARLAYTSQMAGKLADAEVYYKRIYENDSTNIALLYSLGNINLRRGNNIRSLFYFKKILQQDTANLNVYKQLATLSYNMGDLTADITYLQKANKLNPVDPDVAADLATVYITQKVYPRADTVISMALAADSTNLLLVHQKALIDYRLEKYPQTIKLCQQLTLGGAGASDVINMLGGSYFMIKRYKDCLSTFETLEQNKTATETSYYYMAMSHKELGEQEEAILYLNKAIKEAISSNVDSYYSEMGDSYDKLHQLKKAVNAYQKSLLYDNKPVITYYLLANLYDSELRNKTNAIKYYKKYIKVNPPRKQNSYLTYAISRLKSLTH